MSLLLKGILLGVIHLTLVTSLGAKLLYDRATRPRVWARAAPYDPHLPIRGRYVSLQIEVHPVGISPPEIRSETERPRRLSWVRTVVILSSEDDRLVARRDTAAQEADTYRGDRNAIFFLSLADDSHVAVLAEPVLFFIPEHVPDPSVRPAGEELWVEVTLPKKGPPRPIRLGVKKDGTLTPLELR